MLRTFNIKRGKKNKIRCPFIEIVNRFGAAKLQQQEHFIVCYELESGKLISVIRFLGEMIRKLVLANYFCKSSNTITKKKNN